VTFQQTLFAEDQLARIVNVASVPLRSPFRYPGGKTWLVPHIRRWMWSKPEKPEEFIEPFAGGGIVGLTVAAEGLARHVTLAELDEEIAAVWRCILGRDAPWLAEKIISFLLTPDSLQRELRKRPRSLKEIAFRTVLKNRTYHGGIVAPGSRPLKHGENGRGIHSRWYPSTLRKRIIEIAQMRDRISFLLGDGIEVIRRCARRSNISFFVDPPYTADGKRAGTRLYKHFELDHERLFEVVSSVAGDFLMTYDDAERVRQLARQYGFDTELVAMKNTHHAPMKELLIGRNLDWART